MHNIILIVALLILSGCEDKNPNLVKVSLGTASYHPSFLWTEAGSDNIEKTITLDFNEDAVNGNSQATLQFCDEEWNFIDLKDFYVAIDGKELEKPEFPVNSTQKTVALKIGCRPETEAGNKQIFIKIKQGHSLDYINDMEAENSASVELMRMDFDYEKNMNPLAFILMWIGIVVFSSLLLWLVILRPMVYPRFRNVTKMAIIPNQQPITMRMKGAREIVISNTRVKVSVWSRIFKGEIKSYVCPAIVSPIVFKPKNKKTILVKTNPTYYQVRPSNIIPTIGGQTEIKNVQDNTIIKIK